MAKDAARRASVRAIFERWSREALAGQDHGRASIYAGLRLAGLDRAPCHLGVFNDEATTQDRDLGRVTHAGAIRAALAVTCGFSAV